MIDIDKLSFHILSLINENPGNARLMLSEKDTLTAEGEKVPEYQADISERVLLSNGLIRINESNQYELTEKGKEEYSRLMERSRERLHIEFMSSAKNACDSARRVNDDVLPRMVKAQKKAGKIGLFLSAISAISVLVLVILHLINMNQVNELRKEQQALVKEMNDLRSRQQGQANK